jgi:Bax protein
MYLIKIITIFWISLFFCSASISASALSANCDDKQFDSKHVPQQMSVEEKKLRFRCLVQPELEAVYLELNDQYQRVQNTIIDNENDETIKRLKVDYNADSNQQLLLALKPHPISIAIAQAAIETAWGTSRFFREANNLYGIRSSTQFQPRIAAGKKVGNKVLWLKKYDSIKASIADYYLVLSRAQAYKDFRLLKMKTTDPHQLVKKLRDYSERKGAYVKELSSVIRFNQFDALDL